jgi:membrane-associated HD superfamily phosphohydrolase
VEAASRSLRSPTKDNLKRVISDIFNSYLEDGQLDDCEVSLKELRIVASSFLSVLYSIYHPRVPYPDFDFEMKKKKKDAGGPQANHDRNHKSTEQTQGQPEKA